MALANQREAQNRGRFEKEVWHLPSAGTNSPSKALKVRTLPPRQWHTLARGGQTLGRDPLASIRWDPQQLHRAARGSPLPGPTSVSDGCGTCHPNTKVESTMQEDTRFQKKRNDTMREW